MARQENGERQKTENAILDEALELLDQRITALTVQMAKAKTIEQALELNVQLNNQLIRRKALHSRINPPKGEEMIYNVKILQWDLQKMKWPYLAQLLAPISMSWTMKEMIKSFL